MSVHGRATRCSHRGCFRLAPHGISWGLSSGVVQFWCAAHWPGALVRLVGLLRCAGTVA